MILKNVMHWLVSDVSLSLLSFSRLGNALIRFVTASLMHVTVPKRKANSTDVKGDSPVLPNSVPTANSTVDNEKCKEFCKSDVRSFPFLAPGVFY